MRALRVSLKIKIQQQQKCSSPLVVLVDLGEKNNFGIDLSYVCQIRFEHWFQLIVLAIVEYSTQLIFYLFGRVYRNILPRIDLNKSIRLWSSHYRDILVERIFYDMHLSF